MRLFLASLVLLAASLFASPRAAAAELLTNGDFEAGVSGWQVAGGQFDQALGRGAGGSAAGAITVGQWGAVHLVQGVTLTPGATFLLAGRFISNDGAVNSVRLNLVSTSAAGAIIDTVSAGALTGPGFWSAAVFVPCDAVFGRVDLVVVGTQDATAYVDEISLAGPQALMPCLSPTPTSPPPTVAPPPPTAAPPPPAPTPAPTATAAPPVPAETATVPPSQPTQGMPAPQPSPTAVVATPTPAPPTVAPPPVATPAAAPTPSHGLLVNGGFEAADGGALVAWRKIGGALSQVGSPVRSGSFAARFASSTSSTKWLFQAVAVVPGAWYELGGYIYVDDLKVAAAFLRISWYASDDASGAAIGSVDSTTLLDGPASAYRYLTTGAVRSPPDARSARARILLRPVSAAPAVIYVDDVSFRASAPPALSSGDFPGSTSGSSPPAVATRTRGLISETSSILSASTDGDPQPGTAAAGFDALPTPLVQRAPRLAAESEPPASSADGASWWAWVAAVATVVAVLAGGWSALRWWERRERTN